jgi:hypothetical protein
LSKDGIKDKELTKAEADRLRADEAAVRAKEKVDRNSGDGLDKQEKKDLAPRHGLRQQFRGRSTPNPRRIRGYRLSAGDALA